MPPEIHLPAAASRLAVVAEVGVEKDNEAAHRLYVRLGYEPHGDVLEEYAYTTPDGESARHVVDQWILRKRLLQSQA